MDDGLRALIVTTMENASKRALALAEKFKDASLSDDTLYDELTKTCLELNKYVSYSEKRASQAQLLFWVNSLKTKTGVPKPQPADATDEEKAAMMRAIEMAEPTSTPPAPLITTPTNRN